MNDVIMQKKELYDKLFNLKRNKENDFSNKNTCIHEISLEETGCFWGGITISNKCIFCGEEINSNSETSLITFQVFYDEFGEVMDPYYSLSNIFNIIEGILERYSMEDEIDLIKEIELLNLDNVKINKNQKNKVRKRQD